MAVLGPPCAHYENYQPRIWTVGDSTTTGVGADTLPAWRYGVYSAFSGRVVMVGSQSYGGTPDILGANAAHEGHNSQTIQDLIDGSIIGGTEIYRPDVFHLLAGINDVIDGDNAVTILGRLEDALTEGWNRRQVSWMQMVLSPPFKPLNGPHDTVVQAVMAGIPAMIAGLAFAERVTYVPGMYDACGVDGMNDTYHPNDTGYARAGVVLAAALVTPVALARASYAGPL